MVKGSKLQHADVASPASWVFAIERVTPSADNSFSNLSLSILSIPLLEGSNIRSEKNFLDIAE